MDDTARWNSRGRYFFDAIKSDPAAIERYLRALAAIGSDSAEIYLRSISYREPTLARALADELGFNLPENAALKSRIIDEDPGAACDQWLAELRKNGDPDKALTVRAMYAPVSSLDTCGKLPHVTGMSASIRLNDELIAAAKRQAKLFHRSPPQQI